MPRPLYKSPECLAAEWPEVFENLYINSLPINYIDLIRVEFLNGRKWEIDLKNDTREISISLESLVLETFNDYKDDIIKLEFKIDILKLKADVESQSKNIF
jgi:hypothetical protein